MYIEESIISKIVEIAKERIDECGIRTVDLVAEIFIELLEELGYEDAAGEVFDHYQYEEEDEEDGDE